MKVRKVTTRYKYFDANVPIVVNHMTWDELAAHQQSIRQHVQKWVDAGKPPVIAEMKSMTKAEFCSEYK